MLRIFTPDDSRYGATLNLLSRRGESDLERVEPQVREILSAVKKEGDIAVARCTAQFENRELTTIQMTHDAWHATAAKVSPEIGNALKQAAERIRRYHEHPRDPGFEYEESGVSLGQKVRPMEAVGVYAPGGKARYPSTVLMTAIPAAVAGVPRIVLATPRPTPEVLAAAAVSGVTEVLDMGGAQAIAALAYGTQSIARVDKIVGPGNLYVACAKRLVFGTVDIDSIAGPSEILVIADDQANPAVVAADLLSQAEHDEDAYPLLIALSAKFAEQVNREVVRQLQDLPRKQVAEVSVRERGYCFIASTLEEATDIASRLAPEHLALAVTNPRALLPHIKAAGAIFIGGHTPEAAGDYIAGPSHVLPTGGSARHASPLGVYDFLLRTSLIEYTPQALDQQGDLIELLARLEGLEAHARAVSVRRKGSPVKD